jgi:hypothetical protein
MDRACSTAWEIRELLPKFWQETPKKRDLRVDKRILLKRILRKKDVKMWTGLIWLEIGISSRLCEHCN